MKQHYIYIDGALNIRAGGPAGYLANLELGLKKIKKNKNIEFLFNSKKASIFKKKYKNLTNYNPNNNNVSWDNESNIDNVIFNMQHLDRFGISEKISKFIDMNNISSIHLHSTRDVPKVKNFLDLNNKKIPIIFTTHGPTIPHKGMDIYVSQTLNPENTLRYCNAYENFDIYAFKHSDIFIFPSKEAIESYYTWDKFEKLTKDKEFRFVPTGCKALDITIDSNAYRAKYNIPKDSVVFAYIGRHDTEKGYDVLQALGKYILDKYENVYFLIAGQQSPIVPLVHPRWIEMGIIKTPGNLLNAADCFILPNKITYYDLLLLECLSVGIPILCSNTGGNKSISELTDGITTFNNNIDDLIAVVEEFLKKSNDEINYAKQQNLLCYKKNFTLEIFAQNYYDTIAMIQEEYKGKLI